MHECAAKVMKQLEWVFDSNPKPKDVDAKDTKRKAMNGESS